MDRRTPVTAATSPETVDRCRGWWRHLTLTHQGHPQFVRRGLETRLLGLYLHNWHQPDPGLDLHDHPARFWTWIICGGYIELVAQARTPKKTTARRWRRWSIHHMDLATIHRVTLVEPGTRTLVLRGPRTRRWGYHTPTGWVDHDLYDHANRRPVTVTEAGATSR
jgi:hypothetical protein